MAGAMAWVICGTTGELQETPGLLCHRFLQLLDVCGWVLTILDSGTNSLADAVFEDMVMPDLNRVVNIIKTFVMHL